MNNTHPSNLKVRRLTELPQIPQGEIGESVLYATANNKDYKVGTTTYVEAVVERLGDDLAGIGEVRDEAVEARNDAIVASGAAAASASEAASSATAAEQHAEDSESYASAAEESANLAEQARLSGPPIGYSTRAEMEGNTGEDEGALALVTNDPNPDNNGTWRWSGAAWVQSADRVSGLEQALGGRTYQDFEQMVVTGSKNLFDPAAVITGHWYNNVGIQHNNVARRVTPKIPLGTASKVAISGLNASMIGLPTSYKFARFWSGEESLGAGIYPTEASNLSEMVLDVPAGATSISLNLPLIGDPLPERLQVELGGKVTAFEPYRRTETALPESTFDDLHFDVSDKNLFDGRMVTHRNFTGGTIAISGFEYLVATSFIPVEHGKTYTISGLDPTLVGQEAALDVLGFPRPTATTVFSTENFGAYGADPFTFTVTDPATQYIAIQTARSPSRYLEAFTLPVQVEEGTVATEYEPHRRVRGVAPEINALETSLTKYINQRTDPLTPTTFRSFDVTGLVGPGVVRQEPSRNFGPFGAGYGVAAGSGQDAVGDNMFIAVTGLTPGAKAIYATLACRNSAGDVALPKVKVTPFSVPSGQLIHDFPDPNWGQIGWPDDYVHPSVAYDPVGVAGYKYWMVASILPGYTTGGASWEDEDIFVSNDAKEWLRIRSPYESDRPETAPGLVFPPHALVPSGGRRHGFLPCPAAGDVVEISVPASAVGPELNNVNITLTGTPWKHDPAILIEGGYVYIYHTYHLRYATHPGGNNKFIVCTRTNDGVNWECVRSDGSTLPLNTAAASRQIFTKDGSGRYNYLWFPGNGAYSNPEIIKYGPGDFEFVYGLNFSRRYAGTTPWSFNFADPLPIQDMGSGNHPGLLLSGGTLYLLNQNALYQSTDRGVSFTPLAHYPSWRGGNSGQTYKKAMCVGEGGKVVLFDTYSGSISAHALPAGNGYVQTQRRNKMFVQEFPSVAAFTGYAASGLGDGYIDVQVDQLNYADGTRKTDFYPYRGNVTTTAVVNNPHQRVKIADVEVSAGDTIYLYIALVGRSGGSVRFNGLEVL